MSRHLVPGLTILAPLLGMLVHACGSEDPPSPSATPSPCLRGTVWVEDLFTLNAPELGQVLTVDAKLEPCNVRTESYQEIPGQPLGCQVNLHYAHEGELTEMDAGAIDIRIDGPVGETPLARCTFMRQQGYRCAHEAATLTVGGRARVALSPSTLDGYTVPDVSVIVGSAFVLDDASRALLVAMPTDGSAVTLSCAGEGGTCPDPNDQAFTWVDLTTTDADLSNAGSWDLPHGQSEVSLRCMSRDPTGLTIPADAMSFLRYLPPTRIRTEVARAGEAWSSSPDGVYTLQVRAGPTVVGYTTPAPSALDIRTENR